MEFSKFYDLIIHEVPTVARFKYFSKYCTLRFKNYDNDEGPLSDLIVYGVFDEVLSILSKWIDYEDVVEVTIKQHQYDKVVQVRIAPKPFNMLTARCILFAINNSEGILVAEDINVHFSISKMYPRNFYKFGEI